MTRDTLYFELRLMGALLACALGGDMLIGGLWVLSAQSLTGRIAQLSTFPTALAVVWMTLSLLVVPYLLLQVFNCFLQYRATVTRLACRAVLAGGVIWIYLAFLSKNLDYEYVTAIFIANGLLNVGMAAILANSLNTAQKDAQRGTT